MLGHRPRLRVRQALVEQRLLAIEHVSLVAQRAAGQPRQHQAGGDDRNQKH